jgi:hypothetical protein
VRRRGVFPLFDEWWGEGERFEVDEEDIGPLEEPEELSVSKEVEGGWIDWCRWDGFA